MRDRKYKFWDKHNKVWVGPYTLKQLADEDAFSSDREWKPICSKWECFECVEYIGRKDRKSEEVYDGDIVRGYHAIPSEGPIFQVYWNEDQWDVKDARGMGYDRGYYENGSIAWVELEVIGNIYEHPELIR